MQPAHSRSDTEHKQPSGKRVFKRACNALTPRQHSNLFNEERAKVILHQQHRRRGSDLWNQLVKWLIMGRGAAQGCLFLYDINIVKPLSHSVLMLLTQWIEGGQRCMETHSGVRSKTLIIQSSQVRTIYCCQHGQVYFGVGQRVQRC